MSEATKLPWIKTVSPLVKGKGTELSINGHKYVFRANEYGDFVAEIPYPRDYDAILSISAGYMPYDMDAEHPEGLPEPVVAPLLPQSRKSPHSKDTKNLLQETPKRGPGRPATKRHVEAQLPTVDPALG